MSTSLDTYYYWCCNRRIDSPYRYHYCILHIPGLAGNQTSTQPEDIQPTACGKLVSRKHPVTVATAKVEDNLRLHYTSSEAKL